MEPAAERPSVWSRAAGSVAPGETVKFRLFRRSKAVEAFIVNAGGVFRAYVNRCPHAGTPLDLWPNEFLTEDGRHLICSTHGAIFDCHTGLCLEGPCPGARLEHLSVEASGSSLVVRCPS